MLIKKSHQLMTRRIRIDLPRETWAELDRLETDAKAAGLSVDVSAALAESLTRMIGRARGVVAAPVRASDRRDTSTDNGS